MKDPFQDVDAFGEKFLDLVVPALESRAAEEQIGPLIDRYLDLLTWPADGIHIEIGTGGGPIARRMGSRAQSGKVIGIDPSNGLIEKAKEAAIEFPNVSFEVGDGSALRFADGSIDNVVMHTVLSHVPDPVILLAEACRVLKAGGRVVVCDADFEKSSLGGFEGDPLNACADYFVQNFVTHPYLISSIRQQAESAGFLIEDFRIDSRAIIDTDGGLAWIMMGTGQMVAQGLIADELAKALVNEYNRRKDNGTLYGFQPFGTLIARKP